MSRTATESSLNKTIRENYTMEHSKSVLFTRVLFGWRRQNGHVARMRNTKTLYKFLVRKLEGNRVWRCSSRREDNIKTGLRGTDCKGLEWIQTVQDRI